MGDRQDFRKLKVWEQSHELTLALYELTRGFPKEELFGLTSQLRRAAVSVELNLAEGCGRGTDLDFNRFVVMAIGSASEVECLLLLTRDLNLVSSGKGGARLNECAVIKRMLIALSQKLTARWHSFATHLLENGYELIRSRPLAHPCGASRCARIPNSVSQTELVACDGQAGVGGEESVGCVGRDEKSRV